VNVSIKRSGTVSLFEPTRYRIQLTQSDEAQDSDMRETVITYDSLNYFMWKAYFVGKVVENSAEMARSCHDINNNLVCSVRTIVINTKLEFNACLYRYNRLNCGYHVAVSSHCH
jgi:hypothetical protein